LVLQPLFDLLYQPWIMNDDECGAISKMIGRGTKELEENMPHVI
jgi:hypothetical protein